MTQRARIHSIDGKRVEVLLTQFQVDVCKEHAYIRKIKGEWRLTVAGREALIEAEKTGEVE